MMWWYIERDWRSGHVWDKRKDGEIGKKGKAQKNESGQGPAS